MVKHKQIIPCTFTSKLTGSGFQVMATAIPKWTLIFAFSISIADILVLATKVCLPQKKPLHTHAILSTACIFARLLLHYEFGADPRLSEL